MESLHSPSFATGIAPSRTERPGVSGADPGEQPQRLAQSGVDGGREQEDGQEGGGHAGG